ncbi:GNAT family protein [Streptosporangium canum]|uniref:GNAT family N-acetyltransferase n=1 Tax=Streptosporangium canum TaxID=324952 RepID=UPI0033AB36BB
MAAQCDVSADQIQVQLPRYLLRTKFCCVEIDALIHVGVQPLMLWVVADNVAAVQAYRKVGFVEEGRRREAFRTGGKRYDYLMMGLLSSELR